MNARQLFQKHVAATSPAPLAMHIVRASGSYLYSAEGMEYIDLIGGISVCNVGHCHPHVVQAITEQAGNYLHAMVYGELVQSPQVLFAAKLCSLLPPVLNNVYFTNSGAEAIEGALKLARRATGRPGVVAAHLSYHGSTTGALALLGDEYFRNAFRPLMPGVRHERYNSLELLQAINQDTCCVVLETVQAEAGISVPDVAWLQAVRSKCSETGALLVMDEIQCGFGRTGSLWGFEQFGIVPDILLLGKALGGGMPLGAFVADAALMHHLTEHPVLGHITTFGGHPVSCAAGLAALDVLLDERMTEGVAAKARLFRSALEDHPAVASIRNAGLLMAIDLRHAESVQEVIRQCMDAGVFTDWFLFAPHCIRIAPPLNIPDEAIKKACAVLCTCFDSIRLPASRQA